MYRFFKHPNILSVKSLLLANGLPTEDIEEKHLEHFFAYGDEESIVGIVGLEVYQGVGLLRSLAVSCDVQGKGYGKQLVAAIEDHAKSMGVKELYLLTTSAEMFFEKVHYTYAHRDLAPDSLKAFKEFTSLCPQSATLMCKQL